ncbi:MAG: hypothetical protein HY547_02970 [Elusimicrobia bacterium]|nr:hypothetical protein [Elusimicrobiota bacterium]
MRQNSTLPIYINVRVAPQLPMAIRNLPMDEEDAEKLLDSRKGKPLARMPISADIEFSAGKTADQPMIEERENLTDNLLRLLASVPLNINRVEFYVEEINISTRTHALVRKKIKKLWEKSFTPEDWERSATDKMFENFASWPVGTDGEFQDFGQSEGNRALSVLGSQGMADYELHKQEGLKAAQEKDWKKCVENFESIMAQDPAHWFANLQAANCYLGVDVNRAFQHAAVALNSFRHRSLYLIVADGYSKKDNREKALFWLDKALSGGLVIKRKDIEDEFPKYKDDAGFQSLLQQYGIQ